MKGALFRGVILGAPGSGKGTISERIVKYFGVKHLSSGDMLRNQMAARTELGVAARDFIDKGALVPDDLVLKLVLAEIQRNEGRNWILDGFPRTRLQAEQLWNKRHITSVINLNVPFDAIVDRLKARWVHLPSGRIYNLEFSPPKEPGKDDVTGEPLVQRIDDQPATVLARLKVYSDTVSPVVDFFREKGVVVDFEGRETNKIWPHVEAHLRVMLQARSSEAQ